MRAAACPDGGLLWRISVRASGGTAARSGARGRLGTGSRAGVSVLERRRSRVRVRALCERALRRLHVVERLQARRGVHVDGDGDGVPSGVARAAAAGSCAARLRPPPSAPPSPSPSPAAGDPFARARQSCADETNRYRATLRLPPLAVRPQASACGDDEARGDAQANRAHASFSASASRARRTSAPAGRDRRTPSSRRASR